ncbi:unnamed protein product [Orchesella dallaii]|uniref:Uncharacterized protein n=1 Tax=Orchesella dallaii TaxID=48710 RepID=A0ABP1RZN4_9HEXA
MCTFFLNLLQRCIGFCCPKFQQQEINSEDLELVQIPDAPKPNGLPEAGPPPQPGPSSLAVPARSPLAKEEEISEKLRSKQKSPHASQTSLISEFNRTNFNRKGRKGRNNSTRELDRDYTSL